MAQVDRINGLVGNLGCKAPCLCATLGPIALVGEQVIDNVQTALSRVLVRYQSNPVDNGIYLSNPLGWTREPDFDGVGDALQGTLIPVSNGTVSKGTVFQVSTVAPQIGLSALSFSPLSTSLNVVSFGAIGDGVADDTAALQAALAASKHVILPSGHRFLIKSPIVYTDFHHLEFQGDAKLLAGADGVVMLYCPAHSYGAKLINPSFDGNGHAGVVAVSAASMRLYGAAIVNPTFTNLDTGLFLKDCFGLLVSNPSSYNNVPFPIKLIDDNAGLTIVNPSFDNTGLLNGSGISIGHTIYGQLGVSVIGGFIQGFFNGIVDSGIGTSVQGTYFESNLVADINSGAATGFIYQATQHWANVGAVAFYGRNNDGGSILAPTLGSGARTNGLFDYDASNTNCYYYNPGSASAKNTVGATAIGIGTLAKEVSAVFVPTIVGLTTAGTATYSTQSGTIRRIGKRIFVDISIAWAGHTGTGGTSIVGVPTTTQFSPAASAIGLSAKLNPVGIPFTGPIVGAQLSGTGTNISCTQTSTTGVASFLPLSASGSITLQLSYEALFN